MVTFYVIDSFKAMLLENIIYGTSKTVVTN